MAYSFFQLLWLLLGLSITVTARACGEHGDKGQADKTMVARGCEDKETTSRPDEVLVARADNLRLNLTLPLSVGKASRFLEIQDSFHGRRNVSYVVEDNGLAIVDGDVVYGTEQELLANQYKSGSGAGNGGGSLFNGTVQTFGFTIRRPWPNGVIRYKFDSDGTQALLRDQVPQAIKAWTDAIPWLRFQAEAVNDAVLSLDVITIFANQNGRCWSTLGYRGPFGNQVMQMNLARDRNTGAQLCAPATPAHEFGHAIGLHHEHQRPDRDNYVNYHCENLWRGSGFRCIASWPFWTTTFTDCCSSSIPSGCCPNRGDFAVINNPSIYDSNSPYDINSIMHYSRGVHGNGQGDTLVPARADVVFPATAPGSPSPGDILRVCKLFRAQCPRAIECERKQCPPSCSIIPRCSNARVCHSLTVEPPPCCNPEPENELCRQKQLECRRDCNFLKS